MSLSEAVFEILQKMMVHLGALPVPVGTQQFPRVMNPLEIREKTGHKLGIGLEFRGLLFSVNDVLVESMSDVLEVLVVHPLV